MHFFNQLRSRVIVRTDRSDWFSCKENFTPIKNDYPARSELFIHIKIGSVGIKKNLEKKKKKTVTLFSKGLIWSISSDFWKAYLEPTLTLVTNRSHRALSIQSKIPEISDINQMEQTISVRSDRNIWDYLWRWSTLTGPLISVGRTEVCQFKKVVVSSATFFQEQ